MIGRTLVRALSIAMFKLYFMAGHADDGELGIFPGSICPISVPDSFRHCE